MMKKLLAVAIFALCSASLLANVGVFRGSGQTPILSSTAKIQMVEEEIVMIPIRGNYPTDSSAAHPDQMRFQCRFRLRNLTDEKVTVPVGFPISSEVFRIRKENFDTVNQAVYVSFFNFVAGTKKETYPVRFVVEDKDKKFQNIFLWDMTFQPNEEIELHVFYQTGGYFGLAGTFRDTPWKKQAEWFKKHPWLQKLTTCVGQLQTYVTVTGGCWAGKIEKATFRLYPFMFEEWLTRRGAIEPSPEEKTKKAVNLDPILTAKPTRFWNPAFEQWKLVSPHKTAKKKEQYLELVYEPFEPKTEKDNLIIGYVFPPIPRTVAEFDALIDRLKTSLKEKFTVQEQKLLADFILEFYGIKRDNKALLPLLQTQSWYPMTSPLVPIDPALKARLQDIQ